MQFSNTVLGAAALLFFPSVYAQQSPDGALVPFGTGLPACASQCGPLYDVQGGCAPPAIAQADQSCFCGDARLNAFRNQGTSGVSSICGAGSCTAASDLEAVKSWYTSFCGSSNGGGSPTTTGRGGSSPTGSSNNGNSNNNNSGQSSGGGGGGNWAQTHTKWLIMAIVIVVGIAGIWTAAWFFRRRYLRKKEREIEMSPPVGWGPSQNHVGSSGAGVAGSSAAGGHHKEYVARDTAADGKRLSKGKMGWFKANK